MGRNYRIPARGDAADKKLSEGIGSPGAPYPEATYEMPVEEAFESSAQIAYRGPMHHGISTGHQGTVGIIDPHSPEVQDLAPNSATMGFYPKSHGESKPDPILVQVAEAEKPPTTRIFFSVYTVPLSPGNLQPIRAFGYRQNRLKAKLILKRLTTSAMGPDRVWISDQESPNPLNGLPLDGGDPVFESTTTEDCWVALDPASSANGALLLVYSEYEVIAAAHTPDH